MAQYTTYSAGSVAEGQVVTAAHAGAGSTESGGSATSSFFALNGSGYSGENWGALDFGTSSLSPTLGSQTVTGVNNAANGMTVTLYYDQYSFDSTAPVTLNFYLATDTTTSINTGSTLQYETSSSNPGGLNNPGSAGSFAAGSQLYSLGTGTYPGSTGEANNQALPFTLTLPSAADSYVESQLNEGGNIRIVMTTDETDTDEASFYGVNAATYPGGPGTPPAISFGLITSGGGGNNTSSLYIGSSGNKSATVNVGTLTTNGSGGGAFYAVLKGTQDTVRSRSVIAALTQAIRSTTS